MDEYIKRSEILKHKRLMEGFDWDGNFRDAAVLVEDILKIKATDVVPVRHGRWECNKPCPVCGEDRFEGLDADIWADWEPPYCPNCGAKMDGELNE